MQQRTVTTNGDNVSAIGFGAMRLPTKSGKIDHDKATELINYAIDSGINYLDTAYFYHNGESETFLKNILDKRRDDVYISTKLPVMLVNKAEDLEKFLDTQLKRLGVDCIDFYYLHALNIEKFNELKEFGIFEFLNKAKDDGKIRNIGFSYHDTYESFKIIIDSYPWDMCLLQYNFIDQNSQAGMRGVEYAYDHNVSVFVMEPLKGGLLADSIPDEVVKVFMSENIKDTPASWALKWLLNQKEITCILSGMNETWQVDENINTANETKINSLSDDDLEVYMKIKDVYDDLISINCTGCGYCMDCPNGVNIPSCFKIYNNKHIFKEKTSEYLIQLSGITGGEGSYASKCTSCGACIKKCPQHINIPEKLEIVKSDMEPPGFKYLMKLISKFGKPVYAWYLAHGN